MNTKYANFFQLKGQTIVKCEIGEADVSISLADERRMSLYHDQYCCESVRIEKVFGDVNSVLDSEVIFAEEDSGAADPDWHTARYNDSHTWTKYTLKTANGGYLEFWFLGESNGYYSESVSVYWMK